MGGQWGRVAVIGDVGGHLLELIDALTTLGMDPETWRLPDDLSVIQVGDLVHRGPHSNEVVFFVDHVMRTHPGRWAQLVGNHEELYVAGPVFRWNERISDKAEGVLRHWWARGMMRPAVAVQTRAAGSWLATHAGLTTGFWWRLGAPTTAREAATALNALDRSPASQLWRPGAMLGPAKPTLQAGPVWASAPVELLPGWTAPEGPLMPFHQVHGHSHARDPLTGRVGGPTRMAELTTFDPVAHHEVTTTASGHTVVGIDPGHGTAPAQPWAPLVLTDARLEDMLADL